MADDIVYPDAGTFKWYTDLHEANRLIVLDFPTKPEMRRPFERPIHPKIKGAIASGHGRYAETLTSFTAYTEQFAKIERKISGTEPGWVNDWMPSIDAISLYGYIASRKPRRYIEIGSGVSTQFVRRAITDHGLDTQIISIDPDPRQDIDDLCHEVIRLPLEQVERNFFSGIDKGDILFCDNSHRSFQNSDVTVYMTEILPEMLGKGILTGVHDVFLPYDYPEGWQERYYNEQYLLVGYLLGGSVKVELPCCYCQLDRSFSGLLDPIFALPALRGVARVGGIMWMTT